MSALDVADTAEARAALQPRGVSSASRPAPAAPPAHAGAFSAQVIAGIQALAALDAAGHYRLLAEPALSEAQLLVARGVVEYAQRRSDGGAPLGRAAAAAARDVAGLLARRDPGSRALSDLRLFVDACERLLPRLMDVRRFEVDAVHRLYALVESHAVFDVAEDLRLSTRGRGALGGNEPQWAASLLRRQAVDTDALIAANLALSLSLMAVERLPEALGFAYAMWHSAACAAWRHPSSRGYRRAAALVRRAVAAHRGAAGAAEGEVERRLASGAGMFAQATRLLVRAASDSDAKTRAKAAAIFERKARYAMLHHEHQSLGGRRLVEWFSDEPFQAKAMLEALRNSAWIDAAHPVHSPFFRSLLSAGGRMYGVFSEEEIEALVRYFSLPAADAAGADLPHEYLATIGEALSRAVAVPALEAKRYAGLREAFHLLLHAERYPFALAVARDMVRKNLAKFDALRAAIETIPAFARFEYTPATFVDRVSEIYYRQAAENSSVDLSCDLPSLRTLHLYFSPFALVDGCWLKEASMRGPSSEAAATLEKIFADEIGNSRHEYNHANVYRRLLRDLDWQLPALDEAEYAADERIPLAAFKAPGFLLALNLTQAEFFPELLGVNLAIEMSGLDGFYAAMIRDLEDHQVAADFWRLHISIDNFATGHSRQSIDAIVSHLADTEARHGAAVQQIVWQRVWNGLMTMLYLFGIEFKVLYGARGHVVQ